MKIRKPCLTIRVELAHSDEVAVENLVRTFEGRVKEMTDSVATQYAGKIMVGQSVITLETFPEVR